MRYQGKQSWEDMRPTGVLTVEELVATTPAAYQGLWRYCCDIDLITTVEAGDRCVEEPLGFLLTDGRAVRQTGRYDFIWVRVLDPCAASPARRYRVEGRIVIEIIDPLGFASGRYALEGGPTGANCVRSTEEPEVTVPVDALGSMYLGGVSLHVLAAAGRVDEQRDGALTRADLMFGAGRPPWCTTWF